MSAPLPSVPLTTKSMPESKAASPRPDTSKPSSQNFSKTIQAVHHEIGSHQNRHQPETKKKASSPASQPAHSEKSRKRDANSEGGKDLPSMGVGLPLTLPIPQPVDSKLLKPSLQGLSKGNNPIDAALRQALSASVPNAREGFETRSAPEVKGIDALAFGAQLAANSRTPGAKSIATVIDTLTTQPPVPFAAFSGAGAAGTSTAHAENRMSAQATMNMNQAGFSHALHERVSIMSQTQGVHQARIQLNPPELGPMQVQVKVEGHHTQVLFQVHHAAVSESLEASLPRLREMLAQGGQQQVSVNIQQHTGGWQGMGGQGQQQGYQHSPQTSSSPYTAWMSASAVEGESDIGLSAARHWYGRDTIAIDAYV